MSSNGRPWREQRALVHTVFREFGVGTAILEEKILEESKPMIDALSAQEGPIDPKSVIQVKTIFLQSRLRQRMSLFIRSQHCVFRW